LTDIILHHYPESPFSEKIRLILAYKQLAYQSVIIPVIMPKPDLMALTGGYRKTPVMQIGADIYCDTEIISRVIDRLQPQNSLYPKGQEVILDGLARWTDTTLFRLSVAMAFQPKALAGNPLFQDPERAAAFAADRAELVKGGQSLAIPFAVAHGQFLAHMKELDNQLSGNSAFLSGSTPAIVDFSTYHCIWFIHRNEALRDLFDPFVNLLAWYERMAAFGPAEYEDISGAEAIQIALNSTPEEGGVLEGASLEGISSDGFEYGSEVTVMPTDYGLNPVQGKLISTSEIEIAIKRSESQGGALVLHFPRIGFQINSS
jgi:glutathione S-transferase